MMTQGSSRRWLLVLAALVPASLAPAQVRARHPAIDVHVHLGGVWQYPGSPPNFTEIVNSMNTGNVEAMVDFKALGGIDTGNVPVGIWGTRVDERLALYPPASRSRFTLFANVPIDDENGRFLGDSRPDYATWVASVLEDAIARGASGLKMRFNGGGQRSVTYAADGDLLPLDGPWFEPLWDKVEQLRVPWTLHFGAAYLAEYQPSGWAANYWFELLMHQRERVLRRHPRILHIGAHLGCGIGDLWYVAETIERNPNFYIEVFGHQAQDIFGAVDPEEQAFLERFQDQCVLGTDYMEATMPWLTSYRQRLDMLLPYSEGWPVSDAFFQKYYRDNPRKLLRRNATNAAPVAHPGFAQVRKVGETTALDGRGSLDFEGGALRYQWQQVAGPPAALAGAQTVAPTFTPPEPGLYEFELIVDDGALPSLPRRVSVEAVPDGDVFQEAGGLVVIEAEDYARSVGRGGHSWSFSAARPGYSGAGYLAALPDLGAVVPRDRFRAQAPELEYKVEFSAAGSYVVFVRGLAPDAGADGVHVGLDGQEVRFADQIGPFAQQWGWVRSTRDFDRQTQRAIVGLAALDVATPGLHTVNVWMEEDGFLIDKIVLARHTSTSKAFPLYDPGPGTGPSGSRRTVIGVVTYGFSTPACSGPIPIGVSRTPRAGETRFGVTCLQAPPGASGWLVSGLAPDLPGTPVAGITLHVDPGAPFFLLPALAGANGAAEVPLAIPPGMTGLAFYQQFVWLNTPGCGGSGTLSASDALEATIQ